MSTLTGICELFKKPVMTPDEMITKLNKHRQSAMNKLHGSIHQFDEASQALEMRFDIDETFCHSGEVVQGGFVAGMLDEAMAHVVFVSLLELVVVATLEIKVSYLEITRPGELRAIGRIVKLGNSISFLTAELRNESGELLATATSTAKIIRKQPRP